MRILLVALMIAGPPTIWAVWITSAYIRLRTRMRGLNEPELWLPKSERREHARKLLRREDEQYITTMIERQTGIIGQPKGMK